MKKLLTIISLYLLPILCLAAGSGSFPLSHAKVNLSDVNSLQRGAKYYVNYCLACHSLAYQRYNRIARDLKLSDREVEDNLIFTTDDSGSPTKVGELMTIAMDPKYAKKAFNDALPPDLSLIARSRGADWLYTYLKSFYIDDSRPFGVNNAVFPQVGMPHVLWQLQGWQKPIYKSEIAKDGKPHQVLSGFETVKPGTMNADEYDRAVLDLTNFLVYVSEPAQLVRTSVGKWVIVFLIILAIVTYMLKKEYWRSIR